MLYYIYGGRIDDDGNFINGEDEPLYSAVDGAVALKRGIHEAELGEYEVVYIEHTMLDGTLKPFALFWGECAGVVLWQQYLSLSARWGEPRPICSHPAWEGEIKSVAAVAEFKGAVVYPIVSLLVLPVAKFLRMITRKEAEDGSV